MTPPKIGGRNQKTEVYSTGYDRRTRRSIRLQFTMRPRKLHGSIRCMRQVTVCGGSGNMRLRTLLPSGRSNKSRTWCAFKNCWSGMLPYVFSFQWLAPHEVRAGFYRYMKPGQPPDDKIHIMGKITATAPMCKRGFRSGSISSTDPSGDNSPPQEEFCDHWVGDGYLHCPAREIW